MEKRLAEEEEEEEAERKQKKKKKRRGSRNGDGRSWLRRKLRLGWGEREALVR
jgi:hypothetical protein